MKKQTVIVEFNGLAGLGKSTVAELLKQYLQEEGYKVIGWYRHSFFHSLHPLFSIPYSFRLYNLVKKYANTIVPYRRNRTYEHWTNHFVRMYKSIDKYSDADFAISDEGIIQFLVAMALNDHFPETPLLDSIVERIKKMGVSFIRVDCESHIEVSCNRIIARPSKGMYYEKWSKEDITAQLKVESDNFDYLRSVFSKVYPNQTVITIDTMKSPEDNARMIKEIIKKYNYDSF